MRTASVRAALVSTCILAFLGISHADEGTDDIDFDFEPPEEIGMLGRFAEFFADIFSTPSHAGSYQTAKKRMYRHLEDSESLYCGCPTDLDARRFDAGVCGYEPKNDNERAHRLEAEHVLPAFWIAEFHDGQSCWEADDSCGGARECCLENDERFKTAHNDLVNLKPAIGELNGARSHLIYSLIDGEERAFGECDFEVDRTDDVTEPRDDIRGDLARIYFYMSETYELTYPDDLQSMLEEWDAEDEISQQEIDRNERVQSVQGSSNPFVSVP